MQKIVVDNFGPIKHAEIELRDFVVLIGEQASGKSTLAKLVYFFKYLSGRFFWERGFEQRLNQDFLVPLFTSLTRKYFQEFFGNPKADSKSKIIFYLDVETDAFISIEIVKGGKPIAVEWSTGAKRNLEAFIGKVKEANGGSEILVTGGEARDVLADPSAGRMFKSEILEKTKLWENLVQGVLCDSSVDSTYFPAERELETSFGDYVPSIFQNSHRNNSAILNQAGIIIMREYIEHTALLKNIYRTQGGFKGLIENQKSSSVNSDFTVIEFAVSLVEKILKAEYKFTNQGEVLSVKDSDREVEIFFDEASTGQRETIRILQDAVLVALNGLIEKYITYRVIEEPEAHLFPTAQKYLVELLALTLNVSGGQIFITTHSPYVLSVLSNLLYAKKVSDLGSATIEEIEEKTGMNRKTWLDKNKFAAYTMENGGAKSIFDRVDTGLIEQNYLDQVSEELGMEFQVLHNMRLKQIRAATKK